MEELLDIVNENDEVIDKADFKVVHKKLLLHRASSVLIFKDDSFQEILLTRRSKTIRQPNKLDNCGGHVSSGDSYLKTIKKEFQEELFDKHNSPNIKFEKLFKVRKNSDNDPEFIVVFRTVYSGPFYNFDEEVSEFFFINIDKLKHDIEEHPNKFTETFVYILKKYFKTIKAI